MKRTTSDGMVSLLISAVEKRRDDVKFLLNGDLVQMSAQEEFLRGRGMKMGRSDVYPGFYTEDDYKTALGLIWENRIKGWWNYGSELVEYSVCTRQEYDAALSLL